MYPSSIRNLIECLKDLPGIGEKSAERLAYAIVGFDKDKYIEEQKNKMLLKKAQKLLKAHYFYDRINRLFWCEGIFLLKTSYRLEKIWTTNRISSRMYRQKR